MDVAQPELAIVFGHCQTPCGWIDSWFENSWLPCRRIHGDLDQNKRLRVLRDFKNVDLDVWLRQTLQRVVWIFQVLDPCHQLRYSTRSWELCSPYRSVGRVLVSQVNLLLLLLQTKWVTFKSLKTWLRNMKGLKPASVKVFNQKQVALKKIERDFADETLRANFEKFGKDAHQIGCWFTQKN